MPDGGKILLVLLTGLAEGLVVGTALVAFLILLDIVPRLAQLTGLWGQHRYFQHSIVLGTVAGTLPGVVGFTVSLPPLLVGITGMFLGIFVGMVAAALTEVLNVLPVLSRRLGMTREISFLLAAIILGKIAGSLVYWLVPGFW